MSVASSRDGLKAGRLIQTVGPNAFDSLRALLGNDGAAVGRRFIMSIGDPQEECPRFVREVLRRHEDGWSQYPPIGGTELFRDVFAGWLSRRFQLTAGYVSGALDFLPVSGTREVLFMLASFLLPKQKAGGLPAILIPSPCYPGYVGGAHLSGAETVFVSSSARSSHLPDLDSVPEETWRRTAAFYLTTPGNPQGMCADKAYFRKLLLLAETFDFTVVSDECAIDLYTREKPPGILEVCQEDGTDPNRVVVVQSLSKRSYSAGLRSGCVISGKDLMAEFRRVRGFGGATVPIPIQAASAALWADEEHVTEIRAGLDRKFALAERVFGQRHGMRRPDGGFFLWLSVQDDVRAARELWSVGVKVMPGSFLAGRDAAGVNAGANHIRVALVYKLDELEEALVKIDEVLSAGRPAAALSALTALSPVNTPHVLGRAS